MFWAEIWKNQNLSENFLSLVVKFSTYLNRRVFVMLTHAAWPRKLRSLQHFRCLHSCVCMFIALKSHSFQKLFVHWGIPDFVLFYLHIYIMCQNVCYSTVRFTLKYIYSLTSLVNGRPQEKQKPGLSLLLVLRLLIPWHYRISLMFSDTSTQYSRTSINGTALGPWKFVLDKGSSSH